VNQIISRRVTRPMTSLSNVADDNLWASAPDSAVSRAAALGSPAAIEYLYRRHCKRVYAVCLRMTRNPAEAEDLTHDVFIHLLRKIGSFRGESKFSTWLHRLTINFVLMHFRRRSLQKSQSLDAVDSSLLIARTRNNEASRQLIDRIALDAALAKLPPGSRSVLKLFDIEGYSHEEIANRLGCSVGTSKSQLHRGRMKLRQSLRMPVNVESIVKSPSPISA